MQHTRGVSRLRDASLGRKSEVHYGQVEGLPREPRELQVARKGLLRRRFEDGSVYDEGCAVRPTCWTSQPLLGRDRSLPLALCLLVVRHPRHGFARHALRCFGALPRSAAHWLSCAAGLTVGGADWTRHLCWSTHCRHRALAGLGAALDRRRRTRALLRRLARYLARAPRGCATAAARGRGEGRCRWRGAARPRARSLGVASGRPACLPFGGFVDQGAEWGCRSSDF
mmetsp:Transcript_99675/g.280189  ORF Transcript_99675/g.280189 Transcript_99675/m.280189 type:complete len:227 (+) Transcript_99675:394-1074(+)